MAAVSFEAKERLRASRKAYYEANKERLNARASARRKADPTSNRVAVARYRAANELVLKTKQRVRRRRSLGLSGMGVSYDAARRRFGRKEGALIGNLATRYYLLSGNGSEADFLLSVELQMLLERFESGLLDPELTAKLEAFLLEELAED